MADRTGKRIGNYLLEKSIGQGQFGKVYLAKGEHDHRQYAVKCIKKSSIDMQPMLKKLLKTEVAVMNNINHPNIMHLFEFLESSNNYYLIMQYCNNGDLEGYLAKQKDRLLQEEQAIYFLKQIMNGFQVLHKNKIMHRDFKLANIFLNDDTVIIGDFGFAKSGHDMAQTKLGTPLTMAPELHVNASAYSSKADLWSIGVVYYQLLYGDPPFYALDVPSLMKKINEGSGDNLRFHDNKNQVSENSKDLLRRILQKDPDRRLDWDSFFHHPVFFEEKPPAADQELVKDLFTKFVGNFIINSKKVDQEFQDHQKNCNTKNNIITDPLELNLEKNPEQVSETTGNGSEGMVEANGSRTLVAIFKENSFRYYHEKNKILLIFLTVKKLRQVMKMPQFAMHARPLYLLMLILAKKGAMLSELTLYSLNLKNNIFKLEAFDEYCQNSEECAEAIRLLKEDQPCIFSYHRYLLDRKSEANLNQNDNQLLAWLNMEYIDLKKLDAKARDMYHQVRSMGVPQEVQNNERHRHIYSLAMIFTIYSIKSEIYMPYIVDGGKFQWDNFRQKHENLDGQQLEQIMNNLVC